MQPAAGRAGDRHDEPEGRGRRRADRGARPRTQRRREWRRRRLGARPARHGRPDGARDPRFASTAASACRTPAASCSPMNHFSLARLPAFGGRRPRTIYYMAKAEAHRGARARRVSAAVRLVRRAPGRVRPRGGAAHARGRARRQALGIFAEGTRQLAGVPGPVQPGAAMAALQEDVPVVCAAIHGSQTWKLGNFAPGLDRLGRADAVRRPAARRQGLPRGVRRDRARAAPALAVAGRSARGRPAASRRAAARRSGCRHVTGDLVRHADAAELPESPLRSGRSRSSASRTSASRRS